MPGAIGAAAEEVGEDALCQRGASTSTSTSTSVLRCFAMRRSQISTATVCSLIRQDDITSAAAASDSFVLRETLAYRMFFLSLQLFIFISQHHETGDVEAA